MCPILWLKMLNLNIPTSLFADRGNLYPRKLGVLCIKVEWKINSYKV